MSELSMKRMLEMRQGVTMSYRRIIYVVACLSYFFVYFHRTSSAVMVPELSNTFGILPASMGVLGSIYFYGYALAQLPAGILSDRFGARRTMSVFMFMAGVGAIIFGVAPSFQTAVFGRFLVGLGVGFIYVPIMRLLADWYSKNEFATYSGILLAVGNAGSLASAAPLVLLMGNLGWRKSMMLVGGISILISILTYIVVRNNPKEIDGATIAEIENRSEIKSVESLTLREGIGQVIKSYSFWAITIYLAFLYGTIMGFQGLWAGPYFMTVYGMTKASASNLLTLIPIGMIIGCPLAGLLADKLFRTKKSVVVLGGAVYLSIWVLLVMVPSGLSLTFLKVLMFSYGLFGGFFVVIYAHLKENIPMNLVGTSIGLLNMTVFFFGAIFQQIMSLIVDRYTVDGVIGLDGFRASFIFCLGALICCMALYLTQRNKEVE